MRGDYISRAEAIKAINREADNLEKNGAVPHGQGARTMALVVESLPAADVVEVIHGEWQHHPDCDGYCFCNKCGWGFGDETNFCGNCGADMRGE